MKLLRCALAAVFVAGIGTLPEASAELEWRVDRIGLFGPEHTNAGGGQNSHTREGTASGQTRISLDPLAYLTGESGKTVGGQYRDDAWIYDVRQHQHVNVTQRLAELVPGTQHAFIHRVEPSGVAVGIVDIPNEMYGPGVLTETWRYEHGAFALVQAAPPAGLPPEGTPIHRLVHAPLLANTGAFVGRTDYVSQQTEFHWRSDQGESRLIGFYDDQHRGTFAGSFGAVNDRFGSVVYQDSFAPPFDRYVVGASTQFDRTQFGAEQFAGRTAWFDDGNQTARVGYYDAAHTDADGFQTAEIYATTRSGLVLGESASYSGGEMGNTVWRYDLATGVTKRLGLYDAAHTDPATGVQESRIAHITTDFDPRAISNSRGDIAGISIRFGASGAQGRTAWLADAGGDTAVIGLADPATPPAEQWSNTPFDINEAGQVLGLARRPGWSGSDVYRSSEAAWFYDGTETRRIGLFDAEHTRSTDGFQSVGITSLNESGHVAGGSPRYAANGSSLGNSAWIFNGEETIRVGLTDAAHTDPQTGVQTSLVSAINTAGQAVGWSAALGSPSATPRKNSTAWFYDPLGGYEPLIFDTNATNDRFATQLLGLSDEGVVVGEYLSFEEDATYGQWRPFRWSPQDGMVDLLEVIQQQHPDLRLMGAELIDAESALNGQFLISTGFARDGPPATAGQALFLVTLVPEPSCLALAGLAAAGFGSWRYRRRESNRSA